MNTLTRRRHSLDLAFVISHSPFSICFLLLLINGSLATHESLHAQTALPALMNYQGKVTDSAGAGLGTGTAVNRKIIFRIWDATTAGNKVWTEEQTVTLSNGEFSVLLGSGIVFGAEARPALDTVFAGSGTDRYLELTVDNGDGTINGSDAAITPRQRFTSTSYCFRAKFADSIPSTSDLQLNGSANYGLGWYGTGRTFNGTAIDGPVLFGLSGGALGSVNGAAQNVALRWNATGQVGIGSATLAGAAVNTKLVLQGDDTGAPPLQLNIRGNTDTNKRLLIGYNTTGNYGALQAYSAASTATTLLLNQAGGSVGIGNAAPTATLDVTGGVKSTGAAGHTFNSGDTDGGLFSPADGIVTLQTNATERVRVNSSGNVGIGTTTPNFRLSLGTLHANTKIALFDDGVEAYGLGLQSSQLRFHVGSSAARFSFLNAPAGTEVMTILGTGNVGINTATPQALLHVNNGGGGKSIQINLSNYRTEIGMGDNLGAGDANAFYINARGDNDMFGNIQFYTNNVRRMLIGNDGGTLLNSTTPANALEVSSNGTYQLKLTRTASGSAWQFAVHSSSSNLDLHYNGVSKGAFLNSTGAYNVASDRRLKTKIKPLEPVLDRVMQLEPSSYWFKDAQDAPTPAIGLIAQDVEPLFPEVVTGRGDEVRRMDYTALVPVTIKAVQELKTAHDKSLSELRDENAALRKRVAELEANDETQDAKLAAIEAMLTGDKPTALKSVATAK